MRYPRPTTRPSPLTPCTEAAPLRGALLGHEYAPASPGKSPWCVYCKRRKLRLRVEVPSVLVLREKHGNGYFLVQTDEELLQVAKMVVAGRKRQRWYGEPRAAVELDFTAEDIEKMPKSLQKVAREKLAEVRERQEWTEEEAEVWELVEASEKDESGVLAYEVLWRRREYEYEGFKIEMLSAKYGV